VYSDLKSNYKPLFVYVSLQISPTDIDVNVHPTKNQVHLLDEDKIISKLAIVLDQALSDIPETSKMKKQRNKEPLPKEATIDYYFKKMTIQRNGESNKSSCIDIPPSSPKADPVKVIQFICILLYTNIN
jgi:DNA mismatch repair ATPase MutL